jgi:hypothetical protein
LKEASETDAASPSQVPHKVLPALPPPEVYEEEYCYWPWGGVIDITAEWVRAHANHSSIVLDYMCGTGFLLNQLSRHRPDLILSGRSLTPAYITYANQKYPHLDIRLEDALTYDPPTPPDIVVCTAGLHHLDRGLQPVFIAKVASELSAGKYLLLGEELIRPYQGEVDRRLAVLELWTELMAYAIKKEATPEVIKAAGDGLVNDLYERGEFKFTYDQVIELLKPHFDVDSVTAVWPGSNYKFGDFLFVCRKR